MKCKISRILRLMMLIICSLVIMLEITMDSKCFYKSNTESLGSDYLEILFNALLYFLDLIDYLIIIAIESF